MLNPGEKPNNLTELVGRMRSGDSDARDELANAVYERLAIMTRKMLRAAPSAVNRWDQTGDLLHSAWFRIERALLDDSLVVKDDSHLFRLLARHVRFQLIDLYRSNVGAYGIDANHGTVAGMCTDKSHAPAALQPHDENSDLHRLIAWGEFHQCVENLPDDEKAVTELHWYQGLDQSQVANLLGVSVKTVQRTWRRAKIKLGQALDTRAMGS